MGATSRMPASAALGLPLPPVAGADDASLGGTGGTRPPGKPRR
jgi:hypothetical protein